MTIYEFGWERYGSPEALDDYETWVRNIQQRVPTTERIASRRKRIASRVRYAKEKERRITQYEERKKNRKVISITTAIQSKKDEIRKSALWERPFTHRERCELIRSMAPEIRELEAEYERVTGEPYSSWRKVQLIERKAKKNSAGRKNC